MNHLLTISYVAYFIFKKINTNVEFGWRVFVRASVKLDCSYFACESSALLRGF